MSNRIFIFIFGFICVLGLFSKAIGKSAISPNVSFSGQSNAMYFFDRDDAKLYRYNTNGRLVKTYIIEELGEDLRTGKY